MKKFISITVLLATLLTGCSSSISKDEYDSKVAELEKVQKELTDLKKENAEEGIKQAGAKAWVYESFGENVPYVVVANNLYVTIDSGYTLSQKSIEALWTNVQASFSLYGTYYRENPDKLPYDSVTIIVMEEATGLDMMSFQFRKAADSSFTNASMVNLQDMTKIVPYLNNALK